MFSSQLSLVFTFGPWPFNKGDVTSALVYAEIVFVGHISCCVFPVYLWRIGCFESSMYAIGQCSVEAVRQAILWGRIPQARRMLSVELGKYLTSSCG